MFVQPFFGWCFFNCFEANLRQAIAINWMLAASPKLRYSSAGPKYVLIRSVQTWMSMLLSFGMSQMYPGICLARVIKVFPFQPEVFVGHQSKRGSGLYREFTCNIWRVSPLMSFIPINLWKLVLNGWEFCCGEWRFKVCTLWKMRLYICSMYDIRYHIIITIQIDSNNLIYIVIQSSLYIFLTESSHVFPAKNNVHLNLLIKARASGQSTWHSKPELRQFLGKPFSNWFPRMAFCACIVYYT